MTDVSVKGLKELNAFLQQLPAKIEANVLRGALRAGAKVVQEEVKREAPVKSGLLRDGVKVGTKSQRGRVFARVRLTGKHAYLGRWLEYGVAAHRIVAGKGGWLFFGKFAKSVNHPGLQPKPFMLPALHTQAQPALLAAGNYMKQRLATKHGLDTSDVEISAE